MTIAFIGGGIMGEAMLKSILKENIASPGEIIVSDVSPNRRSTLESLYNVRASAHNLEAAEQGEIIILAVKPQAMPEVMAELKGKIPSHNPVISI
ncbi:MAG: NAD(P)-binding domain-containing protein, partial [Dehalococcoidia bacterium]|nr:NAD(P)-binding domain-containing protein [Dehalococcoidia bacterium]